MNTMQLEDRATLPQDLTVDQLIRGWELGQARRGHATVDMLQDSLFAAGELHGAMPMRLATRARRGRPSF